MISGLDYKEIAEKFKEDIIKSLVKAGMDEKTAAARADALINGSIKVAENFEQSVKSTSVVE